MPYAVVCRLANGLVLGATTIRGTAIDRSAPRPAYLIYGWALTEGVPDEVWEPWIKANQRSLIVTSGMIFGSQDLIEARRFAYEHRSAAGFVTGAPRTTLSL